MYENQQQYGGDRRTKPNGNGRQAQEEASIKEHFINVGAAQDTGNEFIREFDKDYHRGFGKFPAVMYDGRKFCLSINKNGRINRFHQI